jgi:hypothetical protein
MKKRITENKILREEETKGMKEHERRLIKTEREGEKRQ